MNTPLITGAPTLPVLLLALLAGACGLGQDQDGDTGTDTAADLQDTVDARDVDTEPRCCHLDTPSCECTRIGGSRDEDGNCEEVCDVHHGGWTLRTDENGCLYWHIPEDTPFCSELEEEEPEPVLEEDLEPVPESFPEEDPEPVVEPVPDTGTD